MLRAGIENTIITTKATRAQREKREKIVEVWGGWLALRLGHLA
jgi:hypothetical protein